MIERVELAGAGHAALLVTPPRRVIDVHEVVNRFAFHGSHAVRVAGVLARVALAISGALEASRIDHGCGDVLTRYGDPRAEIVDDASRDGCGAALLNCHEVRHLLENAELPFLEVSVPVNRARSWTTRLERAIADVVDVDRTTLTGPPE